MSDPVTITLSGEAPAELVTQAQYAAREAARPPVPLSGMAALNRGRIIGRLSYGAGCPEAVTVAQMIAADPAAARSAMGYGPNIGLEDMAALDQGKLIGRKSGGTGIPEAVTVAQMIALDPEATREALGLDDEPIATPPPAPTGWTVVTCEAEVLAAVKVPNRLILWVGPITMTQEIVFQVPGVRIYGGEGAKCIRDTPTGQSNIFLVFAPRCEIHDLEIDGKNPLAPLTFGAGGADDPPLDPPTQRQDCAIRINPTYQASPPYYYDTSDFVLDHCHIHHVSRFVWMTSASVSPWADRIRIVNNRMESCNYKGVDLNWNFRDLLIENNWIWGRKIAEPTGRGQRAETTETHSTPGNAIWLGNFSQKCTVRGNDIAQFERHGIESWNDHAGNNATAMDGLIVVDNNIHDMIPSPGVPATRRSMGISIVSGGHGCVVEGNHITNCTWYGIEIMNADNSQGKSLVLGNFIKDIIGCDGYGAWGISINSCNGALVSGNWIENIRSTDDAATVGILVAGGAMVGHPGWISFAGITITGNELVDAGNHGVLIGGEFLNGVETGLRCRAVVKGNTITLTTGRQHRPTIVVEDAVWMAYCGTSAVVKDNEFFYPASMPPSGTWVTSPAPPAPWVHMSGFDLIGCGTVYNGHSGDPPVVGTVIDAQLDIGGSNLSIAY